MTKRDYRADNIRFFLIFLVVFGHLLEQFSGKYTDLLYRGIYSFHIPALIFLTGYFARFDAKKIMLSLVWPYLLLQTLYLLFQGYVLKGEATVTLSYTTPYWLLWYLMAVIFYYLLIPMLQREGRTARIVVFAISVGASLLAGFDKNIGYYLSLSRFFCFLPFFVAGFYWGHHPGSKAHKARLPLGLVCVAVLLLTMPYILRNGALFTRNVLYGSYSYESAGYTWLRRGVLQLTGFAWIGLLLAVMPGKKLPILSTIGKNTLPVFLFHGFAARLLQKMKIFQYSQLGNLLLAVGITLALVLLLGNPVSGWLCKWGFTGHWIDRLTSRKKSGKERIAA